MKTLLSRSAQELDFSWADIPSHILQAELVRRQEQPAKPECGSGPGRDNYNTALHVGALFLILVLSTLACSFPIFVRRFPRIPVPHRFLFLSRHFGTGVLIATAFVHLLPTAFVSMTDPCLPWFWNQGYPAMPGLIAMISVFIVVGIEMFFAMHGAGHVHGSEYDTLPENSTGHRGADYEANGKITKPHDSYNRFRQSLPREDGQSPEVALGDLSPSSERDEDDGDIENTPPSSSRLSPGLPLEDYEPNSPFDPSSDSTALLPSSTTHHKDPHTTHHHHSSSAPPNPQKALLQCLLLEAGILFHSIFIGMALSVSTGPPFLVLLIAISFHQTFEGFALGARIAALVAAPAPTSSNPASASPHARHTPPPPTSTIFDAHSLRPWLMALAYGTTTPLGQALGLAIHRLYDPRSAVGLLTVGVMNAVSSGLLLFAGLVELLAEDFLSERSYDVLRGKRRLEACVSVVAGGLGMAIIGAWA
ncbi:Zinc/iron permease [Viridothelium virens]|uniref:Zinc/iron permease n=1 Tax=Viridothelium virens TaxID=1048519 RepID=A0A6A6HAJ1_VIRVR|nr:Zinc/iron permease [Viridothelium virens]